jgi:molybdenum cofactor sulfurtransferase
MGNNNSRPTATSPVDPASALHHGPRSLKRLKSAPHSLRSLRLLDSRSTSSSFNSFSEKHSEKDKENQHPSRTGHPCVCASPPSCPKSVQPLSVPVITRVHLPSPTAGLLSAPSSARFASESDSAYARFLRDYPQYSSSWHVDALRRSEYDRLTPEETYVDYMGGALYPASLISVHAQFLQTAVLGNTHSESPRSALLSCAAVMTCPLTHRIFSSKLSAALTATARATVLSFFNAPPGSTVIFTANASAALKLVGEAFPFRPGVAFILPEDAHNSVHGIREFAMAKGAQIVYLSSPPRGGVRAQEAFVSSFLSWRI